MRKIYAYSDILDLDSHEFKSIFENGLMITSSSDMAAGIKKSFPQLIKAIDFNTLMKSIYKNWRNPIIDIKNESKASEFFNKKIKTSHTKEEHDKWKGFQKSRSDFIYAIDLLEMAGLKPDCLNGAPQSSALNELKELWEYHIASSIDGGINEKLDFIDSNEKILGLIERAFGDDSVDKRKIILLGYYHITPIEERVFELFEKNGFELVILINYCVDVPLIFEVWERTFSDETLYPPISEWKYIGSPTINPLGDIYAKRDNNTKHSITIEKYPTVIDFIRNIDDSINNGDALYAADVHSADNILVNYYPEKYKERNLTSYPIGRFISIINQMWSQEEERLIIDSEKLLQCFASGLLSSGEKNSRELLSTLEGVLPYFRDCKYVEDWEKRLQVLKRSKDTISKSFSFNSDDRWDEIVSNPFCFLGTMAPLAKDLDDIVSIIGAITDVAKNLFSSPDPISISDYFKKFEKIISEHIDPKSLSEKEKVVINEIIWRMRSVESKHLYMTHDIANAVQVYLAGDIEKEDIRAERKGLVYPFNQIDSSPLNNRKRIHIIMADMDTLPGKESRARWPLTNDLLDYIWANGSNIDRRIIDCLKNTLESKQQYMRYCMYCALQHSDVTISWIEHFYDKTMQPSPYVNILSSALGLKCNCTSDVPISRAIINSISPDSFPEVSFEYKDNLFPIMEPVRAYAMCHRAFIYGYVLENHPVFISNFQQQFVLTNMLSAFKSILPTKEYEIENALFDLLPYLRKLEKRTIIDYSFERKAESSEYNGYRITKLRYVIEIPNREIRRITEDNRAKLPMNKDPLDNVYLPTAIKGACIYCPHSSYCRVAVFSLDQEDYYERYLETTI